jgi:cytochrome P450
MIDSQNGGALVTNVAGRLASTFPVLRASPFAPPVEYRRWRDESPVRRVTLPNGTSAWVLTRYEDVRKVLTDPRFSSDRRKPGFPLLTEEQQDADPDFRPSMIAMDGAEHSQARRAVIGEFTVKRTETLRPRIQQIVDEHIDTMIAGRRPVDLVAALALPVPSLVICELLGVPYRDHAIFQAWSSALVSRSNTAEERHAALGGLLLYLHDLVSAKERDPGDDLLGRQILKQRRNGAVDHQALIGLAFLLLIAGHETTANMISLGTLALLESPDQLAAIREDPSRTPGAVEELLRYFTIADFVPARAVLADVVVGDVLIRAGEGVIVLGNAANHDPAAFPRPDELDIGRNARHHVAFGFGPHQCLGQHLARMELQIVFDTLCRRIPGLRLATTIEELPFKDDAIVYGLYELPVTW